MLPFCLWQWQVHFVIVLMCVWMLSLKIQQQFVWMVSKLLVIVSFNVYVTMLLISLRAISQTNAPKLKCNSVCWQDFHLFVCQQLMLKQMWLKSTNIFACVSYVIYVTWFVSIINTYCFWCWGLMWKQTVHWKCITYFAYSQHTCAHSHTHTPPPCVIFLGN